MPSKVSARQFTQLADNMRKNKVIIEGGASNIFDVARQVGVPEAIIAGDYNAANLSAKDKREIKRLEQVKNLSVPRQASLILQSVFYFSYSTHILPYLSEVGQKFMTQNKIRKDSILKAGARGKKKTVAEVTYQVKQKDPLLYFPIKWFRRDKDLARPYNKHWGAPRRWAAYGMETITIFKEIHQGGEKGTEFQGYGYHPRKGKNLRTAKFPQDYFMFIRRGYPGGIGNKLTGRDGVDFPIHVTALENPNVQPKIFDDLSAAGLAFAAAWGGATVKLSSGAFQDLKRLPPAS